MSWNKLEKANPDDENEIQQFEKREEVVVARASIESLEAEKTSALTQIKILEDRVAEIDATIAELEKL